MSMIIPKEDRKYYVSPVQREILIDLVSLPDLKDHFFLTGGTALSVFYLYHRISNDLYLFSLDDIDFSHLSFTIKTMCHMKFRS